MKNDKILLYYGIEEGECGIYHSFEAVDPDAPGDDEGVAGRLAELLDCKAEDDRFAYNSMLIQLPDSLVERIKAEAIQEYLKNEEKAEVADKVYTHSEAAVIVELFEDVLELHGVTIPSPEDYERGEGDGRLYGSTYYGLMEAVEATLIEMATRVKKGAEVIEDVFP